MRRRASWRRSPTHVITAILQRTPAADGTSPQAFVRRNQPAREGTKRAGHALRSVVRPTSYLLKKLVLPLPIKGGGLLRTVDDARAYVLALPSPIQPEWELAWTLISKEADIPAVTRQVLIALLLADQLDLKVLARMIGARRR